MERRCVQLSLCSVGVAINRSESTSCLEHMNSVVHRPRMIYDGKASAIGENSNEIHRRFLARDFRFRRKRRASNPRGSLTKSQKTKYRAGKRRKIGRVD